MEKVDNQSFQVDVTAYLPLVERMARRMKSKVGPAALEDLISFGTLGLLEAAKRYDPGQETPFEVFARPRIRGAMIDGLRTESRISRRQWERVRKLQMAFDTLLAEGRQATDDEVCRELGIDRETFLGWLEEAEQSQVLSLDQIVYSQDGEEFFVADMIQDVRSEGPERYVSRRELRRILVEAIQRLPRKEQWVLSLHYVEGLSFKEVAEVLGVTPARVSQLHAKAILRLRGQLGRYKHDLVE
ncbi:MAG: FliA/WhiG family RNA polymerase sigma factor [Alicyclobacillaceae bacterium]|nr:FliA/WhiG family RNA polymerase sigma factor [Alicyclobacillaceae bacterium]